MKKWWTRIQKKYHFAVNQTDDSGFIGNAKRVSIVAACGVIVLVLTLIITCVGRPVDAVDNAYTQIAANAYEPGAPQMTGDDDQATSPGYTPPIEQNQNQIQTNTPSNDGQVTSPGYTPPIGQNQNQIQSSGKDITLSHSSLGDNSIQVTVPSMQTSDGPSIWTTTMNGIYEMNYPDYLGGDVTFCDGSNMISMGNNMKVGTSYNDYASLFPLYCGNDSLVWRCNITKQGATGNANNPGGYGSYANITCDFPSKESVDNGSAMTLGKYKQMQEEAGISYEDSIGEDSAGDDSEDSCEAGFFGFGWIFCPGQNLITNLLDGMMGWIEGSMKWTLLADQAESADGTSVRDVWQKFLNIANIIFVVGFLIMIYSMATSTGLSNYEIKRMLPRLVVVAIAVNLSFYICAALVDISNIVGASMYDLIYSNATSGDAWNILGNIANIASNIVLLVLALFLFGGSVIIAFAVIIACLAFRQVALVVLIIASPIAIAMYMLPNTEKWARKWFSMFARLLIIYPAFTAVWGAARLISNTFATNTGASTIPGFVMDFVCAIAPAVAIIPLFKMSGGLMAMAAGAVSGAAARTGIANKVNRAGRHAVVNNPATRGVTRGISNIAGRFGANNIQSTKGNVVTRSARNWAGRKALGIANATNKHADAVNSEIRALDSTAMEAAKNDIAKYNSSQLLAIAKGGAMPDGSATNQYIQRAAMEAAAKSMSAKDVRDMMVNSAEQAAKLKQDGRDREAQSLLNAAASAASESGNWLGGQGALNEFKDGKWGNNAAQAYTNAVASQAGNISKNALSKTSASNQIHMQQQLAAAQQAGNANADNQISHFREASAQVQADPRVMGNMKLDAQQQLTVNQTMRTINEQRAANGIGLDAIRSNINQAQKAYDSAVHTNDQAAIAQAKTVLDGAHRQMAELGDKILTDNTAMSHFNNLSPVDKSYVNRETLRWQGMTTSNPTKGTPPTRP